MKKRVGDWVGNLRCLRIERYRGLKKKKKVHGTHLKEAIRRTGGGGGSRGDVEQKKPWRKKDLKGVDRH